MRGRKLLFAAVCASAAGFAAVGIAFGAGGSQRTIQVLEVSLPGQDRFIDANHNERPDAGDVFHSTVGLHRWAGVKRGARVGRMEVMCTFASESAAHCQATAHLPGGTIQLLGFANLAKSPVQVAIVGGTGAYNGAGGTFTSRTIGESGNSADTFQLLLP